MSLKPSKKSDLGKSWMQPRRDRHKKIQPEYHLIVSEGTNTEPAYFQTIKDVINRYYPGRIGLDIFGAGNNTLSLFEYAKKIAQKSANVYKHIWIVYDTDDFPAEYIDKTVDWCKEESTEETLYHAIWSNQCIELWFLLHFSFLQSDLHRSLYFPKLSEALKTINAGEYKKNRDDMFDVLKPYMDNAIDNAKKLAEINKNKTASHSAPGTQVYKLIETLKPYLTEK